MAFSYVAVSVAIALFVELVFIIIFLTVIVRLPFVSQSTVDAANNTAQTYALEAAVQGGGTALNPRSTFQPGSPYSLKGPAGNTTGSVQYNSTSASFSQVLAFALLISPNGQVIASSFCSLRLRLVHFSVY